LHIEGRRTLRLPDHQASWSAAKFGFAPFEQVKKGGIDRRPERRRLDPLLIDRKGQKNNRGRISTYLKNYAQFIDPVGAS
jgi:hypothetical protein